LSKDVPERTTVAANWIILRQAQDEVGGCDWNPKGGLGANQRLRRAFAPKGRRGVCHPIKKAFHTAQRDER
jgi:hypothetical protein